MKLLGWMHRKFRQNTNEPFKDLVIGQAALDDQLNYQKPNYGNGNKHLKQGQREHNLRKAPAEEDEYEEESSELFHGFLAIGTMGSEQVMTDPSTPTFAISLENITERESEVTENELKLINDELEKVLVAETKDDGCNLSSGRNSHVSNGRSSHGSIITLSGKGIEGTESNGNGNAICPLQGYLFGSAIELSETTTTSSVSKKEQRTSLGELFQRSKAEENSLSGDHKRCDQTQREAEKSAMHLMKKKLTKRMLHASSRPSRTANPDSASADTTKLHKILHMFHRKVHPENSTATQKSVKNHKSNEKKKKAMTERGRNKGEQEDMNPKTALPKESMRHYKTQSNPVLQFALGSGDSFANREHWIKTDADYLVLEL